MQRQGLISNVGLWRTSIFRWVIPNQHFQSTLLGGGHKNEYAVYARENDDNYGRPLNVQYLYCSSQHCEENFSLVIQFCRYIIYILIMTQFLRKSIHKNPETGTAYVTKWLSWLHAELIVVVDSQLRSLLGALRRRGHLAGTQPTTPANQSVPRAESRGELRGSYEWSQWVVTLKTLLIV